MRRTIRVVDKNQSRFRPLARVLAFAAPLLAHLPFLNSCANTSTEIITQDELTWVKSDKEPEVRVVGSENESFSSQSGILLPGLNHLVVDYEHGKIDVPV